jgi:hypothetical protein
MGLLERLYQTSNGRLSPVSTALFRRHQKKEQGEMFALL